MANVAFLGLGKMGSGMAASLAKAGHAVAVWNRSPEKAQSLAAIARVAATPAEAARSADAIFSMVADDEASERAWLAHDGALVGGGRTGHAKPRSAASARPADEALSSSFLLPGDGDTGRQHL